MKTKEQIMNDENENPVPDPTPPPTERPEPPTFPGDRIEKGSQPDIGSPQPRPPDRGEIEELPAEEILYEPEITITMDEIEKEFPAILNSKFMSAKDCNIYWENKNKQEGVKWAISRQRMKLRDELLKFNSWMCKNQYDGKIPLIEDCIKDYLRMVGACEASVKITELIEKDYYEWLIGQEKLKNI